MDTNKHLIFKREEESYNFLYYKEYFFCIRKYILSNGGTTEDAQEIFKETAMEFHSILNKYTNGNKISQDVFISFAKRKWDLKNRKDGNIASLIKTKTLRYHRSFLNILF